ncbi:MAG: uracil-DNA glycosylase [Actinomycetota bacterium]
MASLQRLDSEIIKCGKCPRLVSWREEVAITKRKAFHSEEYWGKPVPGFGPADAKIVIVGLAPGAHGANRTGRVFTGDSSGDWLYAALHKSGLSNQPTSSSRDDGLILNSVRILTAVRCVPPGNKPNPQERDNCASWFEQELRALDQVRVYIALGSFAWDALWRTLRDFDLPLPNRKVPFAHGASVRFGEYLLLGSYHPSQQNTFTGVLKAGEMEKIFDKAGRFTLRST